MKFIVLTHPQKKMPIYVDVYSIVAVEPYIFHDREPVFEEGYTPDEGKDYDTDKIVGAREVYTFIATTLKMHDKTEIVVRERPQTVRAKIERAVEGVEFV